MYHLRYNIKGWPEGVVLLPAGYMIKAIDNVQMLSEAKAHNPGVKTNLRHFVQNQHPGATDAENEQIARDFFDSFIDGTFLEGSTHNIPHWRVDLIEDWNETFGDGMPEDERQRFISLHVAMCKVWKTEYRDRDPRLTNIRLCTANTAVGNNIPIEVARAAQRYDAVLGYHSYVPVRDDTILAAEWAYYSGRFATMDAEFVRQGVTVRWALTEGGAVGYNVGQNGDIHLGPNDGWKRSHVHNGEWEQYAKTIEYFQGKWSAWNKTHGWRAFSVNLFDSSQPGDPAWDSFNILQPEFSKVAQIAQRYPAGDMTPLPQPKFALTHWPTTDTQINQHFGARPSYYAQFGLPGHDGVDIAAGMGDPIYSSAPGRIYRIHNMNDGDPYHNYGNHVRIVHEDGYRSIYSHLLDFAEDIEVGQDILGGVFVGSADSTGNSSGSHLHYGMKHYPIGQAGWPYNLIDPTPFLSEVRPTDPPTPPSDCRGAPRVQYKKTVVLFPPTWIDEPADAQRVADVIMGFWNAQPWSFSPSADEAGIGDLDYKRVLAINPDDWDGPGALQAFFAEHYPGVEVVPIVGDVDEVIAQLQEIADGD